MHYGFAGVAATVLVAWGLSACATLSEGECRTANWYEIGRADGANGQPRARLFEHADACAEYGILPNDEAYYAGRDDGLARYCTPESGFREGRQGNDYQGVCPPGAESAFLRAFNDGAAIHDVEAEIERLEREIDSVENRIDDDAISDSERDDLRREVRALDREYRRLNRELVRVERDAAADDAWMR